jgi:hypothetical protein
VEILERSLDKSISILKKFSAAEVTVKGEWSHLQNILLNIGINVVHAMESVGELRFSTG